MMIKRIFDIVVSLIGLFATSPFFIYAALLIRNEDQGPVFYRGERVGHNGVLFRIYKFRTMVVNAEALGGSSTAADDARITRIGKFLRKYKLDELPQLINVLKGEMSFVGPRPEVRHYVDQYTDEEKLILTVQPGVTDWASIWNADEGAILAGSQDPDKEYETLIRPTKLKLQLKYVRERSMLVDMKIILLTFLALMCPGSEAVRQIQKKG